MSGICGAYGRGDIEEMTRVLAHRGPDDMGFYLEGPVQFGVRRLAVMDVARGHQPLSNEDQSIWVMMDGNVFNHEELRAELAKLEHRFETNSDTEMVAHAFEQWGEESFQRFNGQFAIAVWNGRQLYLGRDRMGEKPLYYYHRGGRFLFASEIKSLLTEISAIPRFTDEFRDFETPLYGDTLFANVRELPPGHFLCWNGKDLKLQSYWRVPSYDGPFRSEADYIEELRWLLKDAVSIRLRGELEVGSFLSGGLDSSIVSCLAKPEHMFTVSFKEAGAVYDELAEARLVANHIGGKLHVAKPRPRDMREMLLSIIWHQDQPVGSTSSLAAFMACKLAAAKGVRALLSGQGADELFGGHTRYVMMLAEDRIGREPIMEHYLPLAQYFWNKDMFGDPAWRYYQIINRGPSTDPKCRSRIKELFANHSRLIDRMGYTDLWVALPTVLTMEDRATAAYGLENRNPFLDHRVVEFAFRLPSELKIKGFAGKTILRKSMRGIVPDPILQRQDKMGMVVPVGKWFRKELKRWADIRVKRFQSLYVANFLNAAWDAAGDRGEFDRKDYMKVCLQMWMECMISKEGPEWDKLRLAPQRD